MIPPPVHRRLRAFAFDPSLSTRLETSLLSEIVLEVPWESLEPGPVGEYLEVVDYDPASEAFYRPVDLNDPHLLAQNGLAPSESNPQFHQQMVYAVAMTTIKHFERALGRVALWSDHRTSPRAGVYKDEFVRRLRIYPHALRDRNAYYSPDKKALLFGYFPVTAKDAHNTPGTVVFTCLSHDIIAHEVTHALLDGVHPRFNEPTNPDVLAFHEAFADIVALFQHFTYPAVLESQVRKTRGHLDTENLLAQLAQQFGRATHGGSALRDALGGKDANGEWQPRVADPRALEHARGPHARGAILVAAVFQAFLRMYRARTEDLFRIATQGTGTLPEGEIHPDLTRRLAMEAASTAGRVLQMCIRAIDYCPPVDITFGDFLRGVVTGDLELAPDDPGGYRVVFVECFREWGIHPRRVNGMGIDALAWPTGRDLLGDAKLQRQLQHGAEDLQPGLRGFVSTVMRNWNLDSDRFQIWLQSDAVRYEMWKWLLDGDRYGRDYAKLFGIVIDDRSAPPTVYRSRTQNGPALEVHSVRPALRRTATGESRTDLVVEITQRRRGYFDPKHQRAADRPGGAQRPPEPDFMYRAGCTVFIDLMTAEVRRVIRTPGTISDSAALEQVRAHYVGETGVFGNAMDAGVAQSLKDRERGARHEPFALLHSQEEL